MSDPKNRITVVAPINIAFIKYWGKREGGEKLVLPTNDSFSITLATKPFRTRTSVMLTNEIQEDILYLNGEKTPVKPDSRLFNVLQAIRANCPEERGKLKAFIVSENNFPTAAGMASSASGMCALSFALVKIFHSSCDVSLLARIGSGSACRSAYGGFVKWHMGSKPDGTDCIAKQFVDHEYWPEMQVLCCVVKGKQKDVSSTGGMQLSIQTSPEMKPRIEKIVPERMAAISEAIKQRNFDLFAEITMKDSNDLQSVCWTTNPPIYYATDDSFALISLVNAYNAKKGGPRKWAYTFDAGANCFMFCLQENLAEIVAVILEHFPTPQEKCAFNRETLFQEAAAVKLPDDLKKMIHYPRKSLEYLLHSPVGSGPQVIDESESLIDPNKPEAKA